MITPQEARKLTDQDKAAVASLEKEIDVALMGYNDIRSVYDIPPSTGERVIREIERRYREVGWNVDREYADGKPERWSFTDAKEYDYPPRIIAMTSTD